MGPTALLPLWRKSCYRLLSPLRNPSSSTGFEPTNLGSNCKHTNHYTTEGDCCELDQSRITHTHTQWHSITTEARGPHETHLPTTCGPRVVCSYSVICPTFPSYGVCPYFFPNEMLAVCTGWNFRVLPDQARWTFSLHSLSPKFTCK
jgi:hypothetical protein